VRSHRARFAVRSWSFGDQSAGEDVTRFDSKRVILSGAKDLTVFLAHRSLTGE
jgi:hypothetical protein